MNWKIIAVISITITFHFGLAFSAPVDHVYVSNERVDKLNLDGSLDKNFRAPNSKNCRALAVDGTSGNVWLGCSSDNYVYLFSSDGVLLNSSDGIQIGGLACVDPFGNAWFADASSNNQVRKFLSDGTYVNAYPVGGSLPNAIACDSLGNVWTVNSPSNNISKLGNDGSLLGTFPVTNTPQGIAVDSENNIWVATNNGYVDKFDNSGSQIGHYGAGNVYGNGIAIDQNGNAWTAQGFFGNVVKLSSDGSILGTYNCPNGPTNIAIDASGNVWVVRPSVDMVTKLSNDGTDLGSFPLSGTNDSGQNDTGFLHQRFVLGYNTVEGPNVWVPLDGGAPAGAVTLTFDTTTTYGDSSYTESGTGTAPPGGWKLGTPARYYDISTTAVYTGNIEVCIGYDETEFNSEGAIRLFHNDGGWVDITTSLDTTNDIVCGNATTLSEFAPMEPSGPGPLIPTLSEWALIILAALLLIAMAWKMRRKPMSA